MPCVGDYDRLTDLILEVKWIQAGVFGQMPYIMMFEGGGGNHFKFHPTEAWKFAFAAQRAAADFEEPDNVWLIRNMEYDEFHVTISGHHNYFTGQGAWKAQSGANDPSHAGTKGAAQAFVAAYYR